MQNCIFYSCIKQFFSYSCPHKSYTDMGFLSFFGKVKDCLVDSIVHFFTYTVAEETKAVLK